jgi:hypothetical protein
MFEPFNALPVNKSGRHCDRDGACPYSKQYGEMHAADRPRLAPSGYSLEPFVPDVEPAPFNPPRSTDYLPSPSPFPPY